MAKFVIVGTAGHIDHGKTALVKALTGKDPDRLPDEKRRGITIDLGFADLTRDRITLSFVDVPGHERFVKNMLAGAHGIDIVSLIVAADEGVMPQTREHFHICRLLGVKRGLIAITKVDLVEPELIELVRAEVAKLVAHSFLAKAPVVAVSSTTGTGLVDLEHALFQIAEELPTRGADLIARLPVDRAFTVKGFGAVVTGTLLSGTIKEGDELQLLPSPLRVRARGLQVHGAQVTSASAGQRAAVNLAGVDVSQISRGMVLAPLSRLQPTSILDVRTDVLSGIPRPLRSRSRVKVHIHAAEALGRVHVLESSGEIAAGQSGWAQLRLESPVMAVAKDRFILRTYSPSQTIAGGEVIDPFASKHRARDLQTIRQQLDALYEATPTQRFAFLVNSAKDHGQQLAEVAARTGWTDELLMSTATHARTSDNIVDCEGVFVSKASLERLKRRAVSEVRAYHQREPLARGLARETLRERQFSHTSLAVFRCVLNQLVADDFLVLDREVVRLRDHGELSAVDSELRDRLVEIYEKAALQPPLLSEVAQKMGFDTSQLRHIRNVIQLLLDAQVLVKASEEMFFHRPAVENLIGKLRAANDNGQKPTIDVTSFKDLTGISRKYAIPLLEFMDRQRITRREGNHRVLL